MTTAARTTLLASLDAEQRAAVETRAPYVAVLAGPGSGKTRVLTARIAHLLEVRQAPSHEIACFVFSRAAAAEIRTRVVAAVGEGLAGLLTVTTFHAFALKVLRACSVETLRTLRWPEAPWRVADELEADEALRGLFDGPEARPEARRTNLTAVRAVSSVHAANGRWGKGPQWDMLSLWWRRLAEQGLVTHDRLLPAAWEALLVDEEAQRVVHDLRFILLDEAQDSTETEARFVRFRGGLGEYPNVLAVGDARQAIFEWRGAHAFGDTLLPWLAERGDVLHLSRSYRVRWPITDFANAVGAATKAPGEPIRPATGTGELRQGLPASSLRNIVWQDVTVHGAGSVAVLCRTNLEVQRAAAEIGEMARAITRVPNESLRVATAGLRLFANYHDDASARIVLAYAGLEPDEIRALEGQAGRERALWAQALQQGVVESVLDEIQDDVWDTLTPILGEDWRTSLNAREAVDRLTDRQEADLIAEAARDGKVAVCTLHGAKGREWDAVTLLTSRDWPGPRPKPEELRLLFVGATRARCSLSVLEE